jgi:2-iminobutanoate/2-iminopropanoate deaminase
MEIKTIRTENAPNPVGPYSQAVVYQGLVYVSGQLAIEPNTGAKRIGSIEEQTEQVLRNMEQILKAAGSGLDDVVKTTVYIADLSLGGRVNEVYSRIFGEHRPARSLVPVKELPQGFLIEIDAIAAIRTLT